MCNFAKYLPTSGVLTTSEQTKKAGRHFSFVSYRIRSVRHGDATTQVLAARTEFLPALVDSHTLCCDAYVRSLTFCVTSAGDPCLAKCRVLILFTTIISGDSLLGELACL